MNQYFERLKWGEELLKAPLKGKYQSTEIMAMLGFLITKAEYFAEDAESAVWEKIKPIYRNEYRRNQLSRMVKQIIKQGYDDVEPLHITKAEIEAISNVTGIQKQKLMFTMLCFVKYRNALYHTDMNWTVASNSQIAKSACVIKPKKTINKYLYELKTDGYIINSRKITSLAKEITYRNEDSETVFVINDMRNLGMVWVDCINYNMKNRKLKHCALCNAPFIDSSTKQNRCYCKECGKLPHYKREKPKS